LTGFGRPELLSPDHEVEAFDCGSAAQTEWLRKYALQAQRADTSRVYVSSYPETQRVAGYYALAAGSIETDEAPDRVARGAGRYRIPVVLLTRLGVDLDAQGHGLGRSLVHDALLQTASIADRLGVRALLVHAETAAAAAFYDQLRAGFQPSPTEPLHLVLLIKDLRRAIHEAAGGSE
jgi:GNAT superfamily N-acetyltransferase